MMARVAPVDAEFFSIRVTDPEQTPGIRSLGGFYDKDKFIALTWDFRERIDVFDYEVAIVQAAWRGLFGREPPIQESTLMSTSRTSSLSKPVGDDPIPVGDLAYIKARGRQQAFNLIQSELRKSGISQATLARRTGKSREVISRLLSRPRNLEQDTLSELIFAITGGGISHGIDYPTAAALPVISRKEPTTTNATVSAPPEVWQAEAALSAEAA